MNLRCRLLAGLLAAALSSASLSAQTRPATRPAVKLEARTDRREAVYSAGDIVRFVVSASGADAPATRSVDYVITNGGNTPLAKGTIDLSSGHSVVKFRATSPGCLRFAATLPVEGNEQPIAAWAGAAVDPLQIEPSLSPPDDFAAFWKKELSRLSTDKPVVTMTPATSPDATIEVVDLQITCPGGKPVSAYYAKPKGAKPGTLPAILFPHSAGVRSSDLNHAVHGAAMGAICIDVNAHGIPNGRPASFYADLANGDLKGYAGRNPEDPEGFYFNGMFLRLMRSLDFLMAQPEWDGRTLIVAGSSQGGGQALVAAGLCPKVTLVCTSVPALCDHTGYLKDRPTGWPHHLSAKSSGKAVQVARYYDAVNFARLAKCESLVTVGLVDRTCPPTTVFSAYNVLPEPKQVLIEPAMGHEFPARLVAKFDEKIREHIAKMKTAAK